MAASILTLYAANPLQSGSSALLLTLTQPAASTSTTGWGVADVAVGTTSRMTATIERPRLEFQAALHPDSAPLNAAEDCFRISDATTGDFSTGTWYSSLSVIAVSSGGDQDGRGRWRIWRSANADGTSATEITQGTMVGTQVTNVSTTVAQSSSASTRVTAFSLSNEYLFLQCAWEIAGALVPTNTRDILIRFGSLGQGVSQAIGSGLITSAFSATGGAAAATKGIGYYANYYRMQVGDAF